MSGGELQASKTERDGLVDTNGTSKRIKKITNKLLQRSTSGQESALSTLST